MGSENRVGSAYFPLADSELKTPEDIIGSARNELERQLYLLQEGIIQGAIGDQSFLINRVRGKLQELNSFEKVIHREVETPEPV
jgi:hypothetical protein